jgi:hypothetical protein
VGGLVILGITAASAGSTMPSLRKTESSGSIGPLSTRSSPCARGSPTSSSIKVALAWPLEFWLKLKTKKAFALLGRLVGRSSGHLKKWSAGQIRRTEEKLGK